MTEPYATVFYIPADDFSNKFRRKDFTTEVAMDKWFDKNEETRKYDVVEVRVYTN
jgi:hypothetical protein